MNEDRPCVGCQRRIEMRGERLAVESSTVLENDGRHPGTAFASWYRHAVHVGGDAGPPHELLSHLGSRHILVLVAKGVAQPIHEEQIVLCIQAKHGETITLVVNGPTVRDISPEGAAMTLHEIGGVDLHDVVGTFCCFVHFFTSEQAAGAWAERHQGTYVVSIAQGFEYGRRINHQLLGTALLDTETSTPKT